jgi:hypothetical protein
MSTTVQSSAKTAWASGLTAFAAFMLLLNGMFQAFQGLIAILNDNLFVKTEDYIFQFDITTWGWFHLIWGVLVIVVGACLFMGQQWAAVAGIILAILQAVSMFWFIPFYPVWSILIIALDVAIIWALSTVRFGDR